MPKITKAHACEERKAKINVLLKETFYMSKVYENPQEQVQIVSVKIICNVSNYSVFKHKVSA